MSIILVGIGILSAFLIYYDRINPDTQLLKTDIDDARRLAFSEGGWNDDLLEDKSVASQLLHIKNDGFAFIVDRDSMQDNGLFMTKFSDLGPDQYVWLVTIKSKENREWNYLIDAKTGSVIQSPDEQIKQYAPINPSKALGDNSSTIRQARGDVTVEFPEGITESKSNPFPARLVVTVGDTVTWKNNDKQVHAVADIASDSHVGKARIFESGLIDTRESFSFTFEQKHAGQIDYACLIHPWEVGSVIVQDR